MSFVFDTLLITIYYVVIFLRQSKYGRNILIASPTLIVILECMDRK